MAGPETRNHSSLPQFTMRCLLLLIVVSAMFVESLPITAKSDAIIAAIKAKLQSVKQDKSSFTSTAAARHYYFFERKFKKYFRKGKKGRKVQKNKYHIVVNRH